MEQSWLHVEDLNNSNREDADEQERIYQKGVFSVIKNESLITLLSRPPFARTEKECRAIADYLKQQTYFKDLARNFKTLLEIAEWIQHRKAQIGQHIYRVHDLADCFYILLQGEVHLTFPEKEVLEVEADSLQQNDTNSAANLRESAFYATAVPALHKNLSVAPASPSREDPLQKPKRLTRHQSLLVEEQVQVQAPALREIFSERIVQMVGRGESFGDVSGSNRRATNAIAKEECYLLLIKKQHFGALASAQVKSESRAKYQLLSSVPLFRMLYRHSLESLVFLMEEVKLGYNNTLYTEDDPIKHVYIILRGEFKLYKRVSCSKQTSASCTLQTQERRQTLKNISFKTIQLGQILACTDAYKKVALHPETCVSKSQDGVVLRAEKTKFFKKLLSPDNNLEEIVPFLEERAALKNREMEEFLRRYEGNALFSRYLHTPSARSRRVNTESTAYRLRSQQKDELRKLSTASNNFFNQINKTVKQEVRSTRISVKRSLGMGEQRGSVPSRIKDIIGIVKQEANYYNIRKPQQNITLFEFSISKVPIHVKKKYEILFKRQKLTN